MTDRIKHQVTLVLTPTYESKPCHVIIKIADKQIERKIEEEQQFTFDYPNSLFFELSICKTGKTLDIVKNNHKQELKISKLTLNGFNCYPALFGEFSIQDNPYVDNKKIQTDNLTLNGIWKLKIPIWNLDGKDGFMLKSKMRDDIGDSTIATFGCSFTYGIKVKIDQPWPNQLAELTGKKVLNFGIGGSNNTEICESAQHYAMNYKVKDIIILLCHFSRLQLTDTHGTVSWNATHDRLPKFKDEIDQIIKYGETEILFAGQSVSLIEKIKKIKEHIDGKVYVSTYIPDHYKCLEKIENKDFVLLPFFELDKKYKFTSDGNHPGPDHHRQFAQSIVTYINKKDSK